MRIGARVEALGDSLFGFGSDGPSLDTRQQTESGRVTGQRAALHGHPAGPQQAGSTRESTGGGRSNDLRPRSPPAGGTGTRQTGPPGQREDGNGRAAHATASDRRCGKKQGGERCKERLLREKKKRYNEPDELNRTNRTAINDTKDGYHRTDQSARGAANGAPYPLAYRRPAARTRRAGVADPCAGLLGRSGQGRGAAEKVAGIKYWITAYDAIASAMEELHLLPEFIREGIGPRGLDAQYGRVLEMIEALEMRNMLGGEEDRLGAIMEINSGAGGTESLDWASMLMRMYMRWGEANGYQVKGGRRAGRRGGRNQVGDSRDSSASSPTATSKARAACTASCAPPRSTQTTSARPPSLRCSYRLRWTTRSRSRSTPPTSNGTHTAAAARAARTSTRSKPAYACATCPRGLWSRTPKRARRS